MDHKMKLTRMTFVLHSHNCHTSSMTRPNAVVKISTKCSILSARTVGQANADRSENTNDADQGAATGAKFRYWIGQTQYLVSLLRTGKTSSTEQVKGSRSRSWSK